MSWSGWARKPQLLSLRVWSLCSATREATMRYGLAYNLSKIPTSIKGYAFGARTAVRFKPISKDMTPYPGMYQTVNPREQKHKHNFAPFNSLLPRFRTYSKDSCYPGAQCQGLSFTGEKSKGQRPHHIQPRDKATKKSHLANEIWISRLGSGSMFTEKNTENRGNRIGLLWSPLPNTSMYTGDS
ncbi:hypothetical protein J1605_008049 [Eschrichtius robustus]|uniref:Uncharacterized protein n=1 Tax=Eschrichtius robustus TaxID=9764 RepID=A0AB34GX56_ESCRO|nr:hypothetical protein J1605_008049 [Eschrichtius robustus]